MGEVSQPEPTQLDIDFELVLNQNGQSVPLNKVSDQLFRTKSTLKKGDKFKVKIANNAECYIYIFGQETDESSYVLFPYTPKHSPYCGITGTRIFPKDYSMEIDAIGERDAMAVVVTEQPIDFKKMNDAINKAASGNLSTKLQNVLSSELTEYSAEATTQGLHFSRNVGGKNAMFVVLEIQK